MKHEQRYQLIQPSEGKDKDVLTKQVRGLLNVAKLLNCSEKTVRRALKTDGIVKKTGIVKVLGKAIQPKFDSKL